MMQRSCFNEVWCDVCDSASGAALFTGAQKAEADQNVQGREACEQKRPEIP